MIAKGNLHGDGGKLARYLLTGEKDEIAEFVEARRLDYLSRDPVQAFETLQKVAEANTNADYPFFHVQTRNPDGDKQLTNAQWLEIIDREEKRLGLTGQPRLVTFHIDRATGEKHAHTAWFRIDLETMRAIDSGLYKNHLKQLSRKLEKEYGLQEVSNFRKPDDPARAADRKEVEEARRLGMDDRTIRANILDCLERTDGGKAFRAALDERGLMLSNGDRRDCFVVIDQAGGQHALNKKLTGLTLREMRDRLGDLDRDQLPGVDQAKAQQHEKYPTKEQARAAWEDQRMKDGRSPEDSGAARDAKEQDGRPEAKHPAYAHEPAVAAKGQERPERRGNAAADIRATWSQSPTGAAFAAAMHDQGYRLARVSPEEARDSERTAAFAKEVGNYAPRYREGEIVAVNERGWTYRLTEKFTGAERADIQKFTAEMKDAELPRMNEAKMAQLAERDRQNADRRETGWHNRPATKMEEKIFSIQEAADRGGMSVSAGLHAEDFTLARVDAAGKAAVDRDQVRKFENEKLAGKTDARLRPTTFKEGELVALNKWGDVYRLNPRFVETDRLERAATGGADKTPTLSAAREHFATARQQQKDDRAAARETVREARQTQRDRDYTADAVKRAVPETARNVGKAALKVVDGARVFASVASWFESAFGMDGNAKPDHQQQQTAPQGGRGAAADDAMEEIYERYQRGEDLSAEAIRNLPRTEWENLRRHGDAEMHRMIRDFEREKEQEVARSWEDYDHDRMGRER